MKSCQNIQNLPPVKFLRFKYKYILLVIYSLLVCFNVCSKNAKYTKGQVGQAIVGRSTFKGNFFNTSAGTIQYWVKLDHTPDKLVNVHLCSIGNNSPNWLTTYIREGKLIVRAKNKEGGSVISVDINDWHINTWYNIALTWGEYHKKGYMLLYINGTLVNKTSRAAIPDINGMKLYLGCNSANWRGITLPGAMDELIVASLPLLPEQIKKNYQQGAKHLPVTLSEGIEFVASFDGSAGYKTSKSTKLAGRELRKYMKKAIVLPHAQKYPDELLYTYEYEPTMKEKSRNVLSDGSEDTKINWKRHKLQITINLQSTSELRLIEITAPKPTIWYRLDEIHVSLDDGSGTFSSPVIIKAYGETPKQTKKLVDETCKTYFYRMKNPGKACRIRIVPKGKAYMSISEIRICGKPI